MRRWILMLAATSVLTFPMTARSTVPEPLAEEEVEETLSPTEQVKRLVDGELSYDEASGDIKTMIDKVAEAQKADKTMRLTAWLAALAALFKLLLSAVKALGGFNFWKERQSAVIRIVTLVLGVSVYFVSSMAGGMIWYEALFLSMSGPGAMVIHEYSRLFRKKKVA